MGGRHVVVNAVTGGLSNLGMSAAGGGVHNFKSGAKAFGAGAFAGALAGGNTPVSPLGAVKSIGGGVGGGWLFR